VEELPVKGIPLEGHLFEGPEPGLDRELEVGSIPREQACIMLGSSRMRRDSRS
jgi:hypothetical protein